MRCERKTDEVILLAVGENLVQDLGRTLGEETEGWL